jgi:hypothetical protein
VRFRIKDHFIGKSVVEFRVNARTVFRVAIIEGVKLIEKEWRNIANSSIRQIEV